MIDWGPNPLIAGKTTQRKKNDQPTSQIQNIKILHNEKCLKWKSFDEGNLKKCMK